jgi:hypothetical protein
VRSATLQQISQALREAAASVLASP